MQPVKLTTDVINIEIVKFASSMSELKSGASRKKLSPNYQQLVIKMLSKN